MVYFEKPAVILKYENESFSQKGYDHLCYEKDIFVVIRKHNLQYVPMNAV